MTTNATSLRPKPRLSFWEIWNMSFGFLGIQFGFALQNANVSRIFETLGADIEQIPILWIAAPLTGLIVQPIIGYFSDRTWNRLGRRRPYFLAGAILASLSLVLMPNSSVLWMAAGMLWIMDASINISMEPFRAFVGDNLSSSQRTTGFAMQSFFIGVGAYVASYLPYMLSNWFGITNTAPEGVIPPHVKLSFYIGGAIFLLSVLWTVFRSKEYSPDEMASFSDNVGHDLYEKPAKTSEEHHRLGRGQSMWGAILILIGLVAAYIFSTQDLDKQLYIFSGLLIVGGGMALVSGLMQQRGINHNSFVGMINDVVGIPKTMMQLAIVQFFSWFALFAMWIYTTSAVTSHIYGTTDTTSQAYNDGADWVGVIFAFYNLVAAIAAFGLPVLAKYTNRKVTHMICLVLGGIGLISIYFVSDPALLRLSMVGVGIAWASILSMPYAILTGSLPPAKMGYFMGVFNYFIVIPQLVAAAILGAIVGSVFGGEAIYALIIGGVSMILAGLLSLWVQDDDDPSQIKQA
ncbi:MAG: MFS transporter [Bacteroidota bacterium]